MRDENAYIISVGNLKGRDHLEDPDLDGRVLEKECGKLCTRFS
jgi:hypothetical protein